jgi:hypothetical protein
MTHLLTAKSCNPFNYTSADYTPLSYTCGHLNDICIISLNRETFCATRNVESTLRYIRLDNRAMVLWIDAIYLNQQDVGARNYQVRQMCYIYSLALSTTVYMGDASFLSSNALKWHFSTEV